MAHMTSRATSPPRLCGSKRWTLDDMVEKPTCTFKSPSELVVFTSLHRNDSGFEQKSKNPTSINISSPVRIQSGQKSTTTIFFPRQHRARRRRRRDAVTAHFLNSVSSSPAQNQPSYQKGDDEAQKYGSHGDSGDRTF